MNENMRIISEFIAAWSSMDVDNLAGYFTENGCYHNMPAGPVVGRKNVRAFIGAFLATWTETKWEVKNMVAAGDIVFAERIDKTKTTSGDVDLPCVGVFEMEAGKIKVWRDYFDMATYTNAMQS